MNHKQSAPDSVEVPRDVMEAELAKARDGLRECRELFEAIVSSQGQIPAYSMGKICARINILLSKKSEEKL